MNYFVLFLKKTFRYLLKPLSFVPAILVAVMIFGFSSQDAVESTSLSTEVTAKIVHSVNYRLHMEWTPAQQELYIQKVEYTVRKVAHFSEYLLFAVTIALPLYVYGCRGLWLPFITILICFAYAGTDEWHQSFTPGRSPQFRDVIIDTCGGAVGAILSHPFLAIGRATIFRPLSLQHERELKEQYYRNLDSKDYDQEAHEKE